MCRVCVCVYNALAGWVIGYGMFLLGVMGYLNYGL